MTTTTSGIKFAICKGYEKVATLPIRKTAGSAGYDFCAIEDITILPYTGPIMLKTGIKAYMPKDVVLQMYVRSSYGVKGLTLGNSVGIIDSDYADNLDNEGNIGIPLINLEGITFHIKAGDRIAQGLFMPFLITEDDDATGERLGGVGSTGVQ